MLFSELQQIMVKKVTFVGWGRPNRPSSISPGSNKGINRENIRKEVKDAFSLFQQLALLKSKTRAYC